MDSSQKLNEYALSSNEYGEDVSAKILSIFGDEETKPTLEKIYEELRRCSEEEKREALLFCAYIVFADNNFDDDEKVFLSDSCQEISVTNFNLEDITSIVQKDKKLDEDTIEKSKKRHGQGFYKFLASVTSGSFKEKMKEQYNKCLLSCEDYSNAVKEMKEIADEDLTFAEKSLNTVSDDLLALSKSIGYNAFKNCKALKGIIYRGSEEDWKKVNNKDELIQQYYNAGKICFIT